MRRSTRVLALLGILAAALLAGCGGGGGKSADEARIEQNLLRLMQGWKFEDIQPFLLFISEDYAFDEQGKADHIASVEADFPFISNFTLAGYNIDVLSGQMASATVNVRFNLVADVSALDQPTSDFQQVSSAAVLEQVWVRDFDGVWRLAAEFTSRAWVLRDLPTIFDISVLPGATFRAGQIYDVFGGARASSDLRITMFPDSVAAADFQPDSIFGFGVTTYSGDFLVSSAAVGEYAFAFIAQADRPGQPVMIGRALRANFIEVQQAAAAAKKRVIPGNRISMFRHMRIKSATGQAK